MTQPEGRLSRQLIRTIHEHGGYAWKVHGNEFTPVGLPDVVGSFRGQFIGAETKMVGNTLNVAQKYRIARLRTAGAFIVAPCMSVAQLEEMLELIEAWKGGIRTAEAEVLLRARYGWGADQ